ncbi:hypothetical protein A3D72_02485 [Candidatus Uhrbacteria bacterium RIFCSPHIGHO2_02_FULL_57_19]|nr:MAG: hypothetical protein A3D72_02485 [Candidatus Uhrbacteria bacterium RIFCSPHIGHO2_02_FULL_57_19]
MPVGESKRKESFAVYIRNFIFGVEDSLVSTVGLLSGVAVAGMSRENIFMAGTVLISVEAFSMAVGSYLSEHSAEEYMNGSSTGVRQPLLAGVIMFFSYFLAGLLPLAPYAFLEPGAALRLSIGISLASLFVLGAVGAKVFRISILRHGLEMLIIGGVAIAVGVLVGNLAGRF